MWADEDGQLWEVSPDCRGAYFLPSDWVRPNLALNVSFTDNELQARTYRPSDPFPGAPSPGRELLRCRRQGG